MHFHVGFLRKTRKFIFLAESKVTTASYLMTTSINLLSSKK